MLTARMMLRIKEQRKKRGLTQAELADLAGVSRSHLTDIENGKKRAHEDHIRAIASALGIPPRELLPEDDPTWSALFDVAQDLSLDNKTRLLDYARTLVAAQRSS